VSNVKEDKIMLEFLQLELQLNEEYEKHLDAAEKKQEELENLIEMLQKKMSETNGITFQSTELLVFILFI
jgi:Skp family chaperone for outer membrane proteins